MKQPCSMTWTSWKITRYICLSNMNTLMCNQTQLKKKWSSLANLSWAEEHRTGPVVHLTEWTEGSGTGLGRLAHRTRSVGHWTTLPERLFLGCLEANTWTRSGGAPNGLTNSIVDFTSNGYVDVVMVRCTRNQSDAPDTTAPHQNNSLPGQTDRHLVCHQPVIVQGLVRRRTM